MVFLPREFLHHWASEYGLTFELEMWPGLFRQTFGAALTLASVSCRPRPRFLLSNLWASCFGGVSWHSFDFLACLLAIVGFAANAPAAASARYFFALACVAGVIALTVIRQAVLTVVFEKMMNSDLHLASAQWALCAKSALSTALVALVLAWASCLGIIHFPSVALLLVALCAMDVNALAFDPFFTLAMMVTANLFHFWLFVTWGKYAAFGASRGSGVPSAVEALVVLPTIMFAFQAQASRSSLPASRPMLSQGSRRGNLSSIFLDCEASFDPSSFASPSPRRLSARAGTTRAPRAATLSFSCWPSTAATCPSTCWRACE